MKGTHLGDWAGLKATGRSMDEPVAFIFEFDTNRLTSEKVYFDMATLVSQLNHQLNHRVDTRITFHTAG
jgi:hypothetical protein